MLLLSFQVHCPTSTISNSLEWLAAPWWFKEVTHSLWWATKWCRWLPSSIKSTIQTSLNMTKSFQRVKSAKKSSLVTSLCLKRWAMSRLLESRRLEETVLIQKISLTGKTMMMRMTLESKHSCRTKQSQSQKRKCVHSTCQIAAAMVKRVHSATTWATSSQLCKRPIIVKTIKSVRFA